MKSNRIFKIVLILSFLFSLKIIFAQSQRALTEEEAVKMAVETSKQLRIVEMKAQGASARAKEMRTYRLPSAKLTAGYTRLSEVPDGSFIIKENEFAPGFPSKDIVRPIAPAILNSYLLKGTIQYNVFTGMKLESNEKAARLSEEAAVLDFSKEKKDIVFNTRTAYWNLFKAIEYNKVVDENLEQVKAHLKDAQNLYAQGMITNNDVLKVQVQLSNVQLLQIDAKNAVKLAMVHLNNLIGQSLDTEIQIVSKIQNTDRTFSNYDSLLYKGWTNREDVKAMELRIQAGEASVRAAKGSYMPQVSLQGNVYYNRPNQRIFPSEDAFKYTWDVGLNATFDLWNWNATAHQVQQAKAVVEQTKDALGLIKDGISLEVTQSYLAMQQAKEKISVTRQTVEQSEESYRITSEKFKKGVALTTDLLDAEVSVLQAKTAYTNAIVDFELAQARLQKAIGQNE